MVSGKSITSPPHTDARTPREQGAAGERQEGTASDPLPGHLAAAVLTHCNQPSPAAAALGAPSPHPPQLSGSGSPLPLWEVFPPFLGGWAAPPPPPWRPGSPTILALSAHPFLHSPKQSRSGCFSADPSEKTPPSASRGHGSHQIGIPRSPFPGHELDCLLSPPFLTGSRHTV